MEKPIVLYLSFLLVLSMGISCENSSKPMDESTAEVKENNSGKLIHTVYFQLKPEANKETLITSLETFEGIEVAKSVEIGESLDTGNPESMLSDHSVTVRITFDNLEDFRIYEKHPIHLASIEDTKELMAAQPIGYDYIVK